MNDHVANTTLNAVNASMELGNEVYRKKHFIIKSFKDEFIVINENKPFDQGHTHIQNLKTAKFIIDLVLQKRCPYDLSEYLLKSLCRLSDEERYEQKIKDVLNKKKHPKRYYRNARCKHCFN